MKTIKLMTLDNVEHLVQPTEFHEITIQSPALHIFTDFKQHVPQVIDADTSADQAAYLMQKSHVRMLLAVDTQEELLGTLSKHELDSQHLQIMQNHGIDRQELTVRDLMIPRTQQKVMKYEDLINASIADVLDTLQKNGKMHCLVVDQKQHQIRGIIAASDIAKRLHMAVEVEAETTFIDIFKAINESVRPSAHTEKLKAAGF